MLNPAFDLDPNDDGEDFFPHGLPVPREEPEERPAPVRVHRAWDEGKEPLWKREKRARRKEAKRGRCPAWYLVVTLTGRAYGGPEEGGWWYDETHIAEVCRVHTFREGLAAARELAAEYPRPRRDRFSVIGGDDPTVWLCYSEACFPEESQGRPRYE